MVIDSAGALVDAVRDADLLDDAQMAQLLRDLRNRFPVARELGRQLMMLGWLTPYQVNQLLQGRGQFLMLGPYRLLARLGAGGMGEVFKARHVRLKRVVALKVIRRELLDQPRLVGRFQREAEAAAQLTHPNIVTLYDADTADGLHFLAMEYVEGPTLHTLVEKTGPLPVAQACDYIRQAALGLHHAHERELVHRDVKPSNFMIVQPADLKPVKDMPPPLVARDYMGATLKVLDLGLARLGSLVEESADTSLTREGIVLGTSDYVAPEQAKNSRLVDGRADLYSLGCTFYFSLTGQHLFPGGSDLEKILKHQLDKPPSVRTIRSDVPREVEAILARLLAKKPEQRFQTGAELADALVPWSIPSTHSPVQVPGTPGGASLPPTRPLGKEPRTPPEGQGVPAGQQIRLAPPRMAGDFQDGRSPSVRPREVGQSHPAGRSQVKRNVFRLFWVLLLGAVLCGLFLAGGIVTIGWFLSNPSPSSTQPKRNSPSLGKADPRVLANYLPSNAMAVVVFRLDAFRKGHRNRRVPSNILVELTSQKSPQLEEVLRISFDRDIKEVRTLWFEGDLKHSLFIVRGRMNPQRFQLGKEKLERDPKERFTLYTLADTDGGSPLTLAVVGEDLLIASTDQKRVLGALGYARTPKDQRKQNTRLKDLLAHRNPDQFLRLAVLASKLPPIPPLQHEMINDTEVQRFLQLTDTIHGGVTFKHGFHGEFAITARDDRDIQNMVKMVKNANHVLWTRPVLPPHRLAIILRYLKVAKVRSDGNTIYLDCRPGWWW